MRLNGCASSTIISVGMFLATEIVTVIVNDIATIIMIKNSARIRTDVSACRSGLRGSHQAEVDPIREMGLHKRQANQREV